MRDDLTPNAKALAQAYGLDGAAYDALATGDAREAASYVASLAGVRAEELLPAGSLALIDSALAGDVRGAARGAAVLAAGVGGTAVCGPVCGAAASVAASVIMPLLGKLFGRDKKKPIPSGVLIAETVRIAARDLITSTDSYLPEASAVQWLNGFFEAAQLSPWPYKQPVERTAGPSDLIWWAEEPFMVPGVRECLYYVPARPPAQSAEEKLIAISRIRFEPSSGHLIVEGTVITDFLGGPSGQLFSGLADRCFIYYAFEENGEVIYRGTALFERRMGVVPEDDDDDSSKAPSGLPSEAEGGPPAIPGKSNRFSRLFGQANVGSLSALGKVFDKLSDEIGPVANPDTPRTLKTDVLSPQRSLSAEVRDRYDAACVAALATFAAENESDRLVAAAQEGPDVLASEIEESVRLGDESLRAKGDKSGDPSAVLFIAVGLVVAIALAGRGK